MCHKEEWKAQRHIKLIDDRGHVARAYKCKSVGKELKFSLTTKIHCVDENFTFHSAYIYDACHNFLVFLINVVAVLDCCK
jgi:hypothetical protein